MQSEVAKSPSTFAWAVAMVSDRKDGGQDPQEWTYGDSRRKETIRDLAHKLLDKVRPIPGTDNDGRNRHDELLNWVHETRRLCAEYGRIAIGDYHIGRVLSRCTSGRNGLWPSEEVSAVLEEIGSEHMAHGLAIGARNARGMSVGRPGGAQEREFANRYRILAKRTQFDYPYVSSVLERIALGYEQEGAWWDWEQNAMDRLSD